MLVGRGVRRTALSAVAVVALAGLPLVAAPTPASAAPVNGLIGYTHTANLDADRGDALAVAPTGGAPTIIAAGAAGPPPVLAAFPLFSPDGTRVVFSRGSEDGSVPLFLAAADGSGRVKLTQTGAPPAQRTQDAPAGFSPDGRLLAFSRIVTTEERTLRQVWVLDLVTKVERRMGGSDHAIYGFSGLAAGGGRGVFSPDGRQVVFGDAPGSADQEIYRADLSTGVVTPVTDFGNAEIARYPVFSPDGSRITFGSGGGAAPDKVCAIVSVPATATGVAASVVTPLTTGPCADDSEIPAPTYSPDGATIAFSRAGALFTPAAAGQLMAIPAAGGNPAALTALPTGGAVAPVWSPDGTRIAFSHLTPAAAASDPPALVVAVVDVADPAHTATPLSAGAGDIVSSWQTVPLGADPCLPGVPVPPPFHLIEGTDADDTLTGTPAPDVIRGRGGDDVINGGDGDDVLCGDRGRDRLLGGPGEDFLRGGGEADVLFGGEGDDVLRGAAGGDDLRGGAGDDVLDGGRGADRLAGGNGSDVLLGGRGFDTGVGGPGSDSFRGIEQQTQ